MLRSSLFEGTAGTIFTVWIGALRACMDFDGLYSALEGTPSFISPSRALGQAAAPTTEVDEHSMKVETLNGAACVLVP